MHLSLGQCFPIQSSRTHRPSMFLLSEDCLAQSSVGAKTWRDRGSPQIILGNILPLRITGLTAVALGVWPRGLDCYWSPCPTSPCDALPERNKILKASVSCAFPFPCHSCYTKGRFKKKKTYMDRSMGKIYVLEAFACLLAFRSNVILCVFILLAYIISLLRRKYKSLMYFL